MKGIRLSITRFLMVMAFVFVGAVSQTFAQSSAVSGKVVDNQGQPLPGVNVIVDGTTQGIITDIEGNYKLNNVPQDGKLKFTFIGYETQTIAVSGQSKIDVTLIEESIDLEDVVVVGYGVQKKSDLTGSVASVKADDIASVAATNAMQAMQAKLPGIDLTQSDGQAGAGVSITIRGNRSISASNSPLIIVDGVEYGSNLDIPANDIESMDVLKDASSTAIYGTKGANGVIIVTTKRGKAGKTRVNANCYWSFNSPTSAVKSMYGDTEVQRWLDRANYKADLASGNWGESNVSIDDVFGSQQLDDGTKIVDLVNEKSYTDWYDVIFQNSLTQNYEISVSGGNDKTNLSISLAAMIDEGLLKNDKFNRYNGRINVDHRINKIFKTGGSMAFTFRDHDARNGSIFGSARKMTSITHAYNEDGTINETPNIWYTAHVNPLMDEDGNYQKNSESSRFLGSTYLQIDFCKPLTFKTQFSVDRSNSRVGQYADYKSVGRYQSPSTTNLSNAWSKSTKFTWQNTLNFNKSFDIHTVGVLLGHEMTKSVSEGINLSGDAGKEHYYNSSFYDVTKITDGEKFSTDYEQQQMLSFFGRLNYSYAGKYLFQASVRADGSSVLAQDHKWGAFPSLSAGWRVIDEDFMDATRDVLSNLKFRASWGLSGNAAVSPYQTMATVTATTPNSATEFIPMSMSNPELSWETTNALDFGLDFGLFENRVNGTFDFYTTKTTDLLYYRSAPASSVFTSVLSNIGESKGSGIELSINALAVKAESGFNWDINASYTHSKDEVVKLADGLDRNITGTTGFIVGEPISIYYDYEVDNCWGIGEYEKYVKSYEARGITFDPGTLANYGAPGSIKIVDRNGDGKIDEDDKRVYNRSPKHIIGMTNTFSFNGLSLSVQAMARLGGYMAYDKNNAIGLDDGDANWADVEYWTPNRQDTKMPSPGAQNNYSAYKSSLLYEKADFFKIKNITLAYSFNKDLISRLKLNSAKVYCSMKNFVTVNRLNDDYDPERGGSINFPLRKQVIVGLNLTF